MKNTYFSSYTISALTPNEAVNLARQIVSLYKQVWVSTYPNKELKITKKGIEKGLNTKELTVKWKKEILGKDDRRVWIVKNQNEIVGFCIAKKDINENELEYIYILPSYQGKGIGKALMDISLEWLGISKPIVLYGAAYNKNAIFFYEKFGFRLSSENLPPKILSNGLEIPSMKMVRE